MNLIHELNKLTLKYLCAINVINVIIAIIAINARLSKHARLSKNSTGVG